MRITTHMFVSRQGNVRVNKTGSGVKPNEIVIDVTFEIPDAFFKKPHPVVKIALPADGAPVEMVIEESAHAVAEALNITVDNARDGLVEAMSRRAEDL